MSGALFNHLTPIEDEFTKAQAAYDAARTELTTAAVARLAAHIVGTEPAVHRVQYIVENDTEGPVLRVTGVQDNQGHDLPEDVLNGVRRVFATATHPLADKWLADQQTEAEVRTFNAFATFADATI